MTYIRSEPRPDLEAMAQADRERALQFADWLSGLFDTPAQRWLEQAGPVAKRLNEEAKEDRP